MAVTMRFGDLDVGDIVAISENGVPVNYIVVHKGLPSDMYDESCNGIWILREQAHSARAWHGTSSTTSINNYENSDINSWLNGDFLNSIDEKIRTVIKTVKIPYKMDTGNSLTEVQWGENGLTCKAFLLSGYEVGFTNSFTSFLPVDGYKLDYFLEGAGVDAIAKRIAKKNNNSVRWWLRSPSKSNNYSSVFVGTSELCGSGSTYNNTGYFVRPAFIISENAPINGVLTVSKPYFETNSFDYNGLVQTPDSSVNFKNFDDSIMTKSGTLSGTSAGEYEIYISLDEGYQWDDGTSGDITLTWKINSIEIPKPTVEPIEYEYDGSGTYDVSYYKLPDISGYNADIMTKSGTGLTRQFKAGSYPVIFSLKDSGSCSWDDGSVEDHVVEWVIKPKSTKIPVVTSEDYVYDGNYHIPIIVNDDLRIMTQSGNTVAQCNANNYYITYTLRDPDSCTWEDGTVEPKTIYWNINKQIIEVEKPYLADDQKSFVYDGYNHTPTITGRNDAKMIVSGNLSATAAGDWEINISLKSNNNIQYQWQGETTDSITLNWAIEKGVFDIPSLAFGETDYNGLSQSNTVTGYNSVVMTQSGIVSAVKSGEYSVIYSLKDKDSAVWSDESTDNKEITWKINSIIVPLPTIPSPKVKVKTYYSGSSVSIYQTDVDIDGFNSNIMNVSGNSGVSPGKYTVIVSIKDPDSCSWSDGSVESVSLDWEILKEIVQYEKPSLSITEFLYDGTTKNIELKKFSSTYYGNNSMKSSGTKSATAADNYTAKVEFYTNSIFEFQWNDGTSDPVELDWIIKKAKFDVPVLSPAAFKYDGKTKKPVESGYNANVMARSSDSVLSSVEAGSKIVEYSLKDASSSSWADGSINDKTVEWRIIMGDPVEIPSVENLTFVYDGNKKALIVNGYDSAVMVQSGTSSAVNAGKYEIVYSLKDPESVCWTDGSVVDKVFEWEIEKKVVQYEKPYLNTTEFDYNGLQRTPIFTGFNSSYMVSSGEISATEAGTYIATVSLKTENNFLYQWTDGSTDPLEFEWHINPIQIDIPTLSETVCYYGGSSYNSSTQKTSYAFRYPSITGFDENIISQTGVSEGYKKTDGSFDKTEGQWYCTSQWRVGKYYVKFSLNHPGSCTWSDGTVNDIIYEWSIVRQVVLVSKPYLINSSFTYDGTEKTPVVTNGDLSGVILSGTISETAVGSYIITASIYRYSSDDDLIDYRWEDNSINDIELDWSIVGGSVSIPTIISDDILYNGSAQSPVISGFDNNTMVKSGDLSKTAAGDYEITISLKDPDSCTWEDGLISDKTLNWSIKKISIEKPIISPGYMEYDGENHTVKFVDNENDHSFIVSGFVPEIMTSSGDLNKTDVGNYNAVISLKDPQSCSWVDGSTNDVLLPWEIRKKIVLLDKPYLEPIEFLYDGKTHTPKIERYKTSGMYVKNGSVTSAIAANDYSITLVLQDDKNITYLWGDPETNSSDEELVLEWVVNKATGENAVEIPTVLPTDFIYDGNYHKPIITGLISDIISVSGVESATNAGEYEIVFTLNDKNSAEWTNGTSDDIAIKWVINKQVIDDEPCLDQTEFVYDGTQHSPEVNNYNVSKMIILGDQSAIEADEYIIIIKPTANYKWADGTDSDLNLGWKIQKRSVEKPTVLPLSFVYNGDTQSPEIFETVSDYVNIEGDTEAVSAGKYEIVFSLKNKQSCQWIDETNGDFSVEWEITTLSVEKPSVDFLNFVYNGLMKTPNFVYDTKFVTFDGDIGAVSAGSYTVVFSLIDKNSCKWADGTTDDIAFNWEISKAYLAKPDIENLEFVYDGNEHAPSISEFDSNVIEINGTVSAVNAGDYEIVFSIKDKNSADWIDRSADDFTIYWSIKKSEVEKPSITNTEFNYNSGTHSPTIHGFDEGVMAYMNGSVNSAVDAGIYQILVDLKDKKNYVWDNGNSDMVSLEWIVHGKPVDEPYLNQNVFLYDGAIHNPNIMGFKSVSMTRNGEISSSDIGEHTIIISLLPNYEWSSGGFDDLVLSWYIGETFITVPKVSELVFEYDGTSHAPKIFDYNNETISQSGVARATNAGNYAITFALKDQNAMWETGGSSDIVVKWTINKKQIEKPTIDPAEFVYSGGEHSPTIHTYPDVNVTGNKNAVNAGNYYLYFSLKDTRNYEWTDGSFGQITIVWKITRKKIEKPYLHNDSFTYDGSSKTPYIVNFNRSIMRVLEGSKTNGVNVGIYKITIQLYETAYENGYERVLHNYEWMDGTTDAVILNWNIGNKKIKHPVITNGTLIYNGFLQSPKILGYISEIMTVVGNLSGNNAGQYQVGFKIKNGANCEWENPEDEGKMLSWEILRKPISKLLYAPKPKDVVYNTYEQFPYRGEYDNFTLSIGGTESAIHVGEYTAQFTPTKNYVWEDGTDDPVEVTWRIVKRPLNIPVQNKPYDYNGKERHQNVCPIQGAVFLKSIEITGEISGTDVGYYDIHCVCSDDCYFIETGTNECDTVWRIQKGKLKAPIGGTYSYTGEIIEAEFRGYDTEIFSVRGEISGIEIGSYTAFFSIKDTNNLEWADDVFPNENGEAAVTWSIRNARKKINIPYQINPPYYDGNPKSPVFANYVENLVILIGGVPSEINAGRYYVTFRLNDNVIWSDGTTEDKVVPWDIYKKRIPCPYIRTSEADGGMYYYTIEGKRYPVWANFDPEIMVLNGDTYDIDNGWHITYFVLKDPDNTEWMCGDYDNYSISWKLSSPYEPDLMTGDGIKVHIPRQVRPPYEDGAVKQPEWDSFNDTAIIKIGGVWEGVSSDAYYVILELADGYVWEDGTTEIKTVQWKILSEDDEQEQETLLVEIHIPEQITPPYFDGYVKEPEWDVWDKFGFDIVQGDLYGVLAGVYYLILRLQTGYIWDDGTTEDKVVTWIINQGDTEIIPDEDVPRSPTPERDNENNKEIISNNGYNCCCATGLFDMLKNPCEEEKQ